MSNEAMTWGVKVHPGKGPKPVLMSLCDRAGDHSGEDWTCYPSIDAIMEWTDYSRRAVERNLLILWKLGIISRSRRRRADGRLGIYDYYIHRDRERWALLAVERADKDDIEDSVRATAPPVILTDGPDVKLTCGPPVILAGTTRHFDAQPPVKMTGQEPSVEPSGKPTSREREPGDDGFDLLVAVWPDSGLKRTSWGKARAAFAWACGMETAERLLAAAKACAADPATAGGDYGWPGLHTWLSEERWRAWLPKASAPAAPPPERIPFAGDLGIFALVARVVGGDQVEDLLQGCVWREADRAILAPTKWRAGKLEDVLTFDWRIKHDIRIKFEGGNP